MTTTVYVWLHYISVAIMFMWGIECFILTLNPRFRITLIMENLGKTRPVLLIKQFFDSWIVNIAILIIGSLLIEKTAPYAIEESGFSFYALTIGFLVGFIGTINFRFSKNKPVWLFFTALGLIAIFAGVDQALQNPESKFVVFYLIELFMVLKVMMYFGLKAKNIS